MKKYLLHTLFFLTAFAGIRAQSADEVLRYSYLIPGGTARFVGAGGAFSAKGAEFGALSQNPAGVAFYRGNEMVVTPSLRFSSVDAALPGSGAVNDKNTSFAFDNFGIAFHTGPRDSKWKTANFAIGLNRQNNYHASIFYEGTGAGTILTGMYKEANLDYDGTSESLYDYGAELAYGAGALFPNDDKSAILYDFIGYEQENLQRSHAVNTSGKMNEMTLTFGGNYDEKLMLGATVGIPFVNYTVNGEYIEEDTRDAVPVFNKLIYTEYLRTEGVGVNLKLGMIYQVSEALRFGAAFHTPTALSLTDTYSTSFDYHYTLDSLEYGGNPVTPEYDGVTDYKLRTPWRASAGIAGSIGKVCFLSGDVEVVDYTHNRYNFTADVPSSANEADERRVNGEIKDQFQQAINLRFGAELALENFRLRGGLNLLGKPQADAEGFNTAYTAGIGVRNKSFFLDLGWRRYIGNGYVRAYTDAPEASTENVTNDILLTLGFKF